MKTILITGASGFVGKAFLKARGADYKIRVFGRKPIEGYEFVQGDIKNREDIERAAKGADAILHMAAATTSTKGATDSDYVETNVLGTLNVLEAAARNNVKKVVYCSSVCAVGFRPTPVLIKETDRPDPSDGMYGYSKYIGEILCQRYSERCGINIICLRVCMVYPLHEFAVPLNPFHPHWLGSVHIDDVVQAFRLAIEDEKVRFDVFHVASGSPHSKFDISKARSVLGYEPKNNFEEYIRLKSAEAKSVAGIFSRLKGLLRL